MEIINVKLKKNKEKTAVRVKNIPPKNEFFQEKMANIINIKLGIR